MNNFKKFTVFYLLCLSFISTSFAVNIDKSINKTFKLNYISNLDISSKYGTIKIKTWDKDSIKFDIQIKVESKKTEKAQNIINDISIDFTQGQTSLLVKSIFGDYFTFRKIGNSLFNNGNVKINYTVYIPSNIDLNISLTNGDLYIPDLDGKTKIEVTNGNLVISKLVKNAYLTVKGTNVKIDKIKFLELNSKNSVLNIEDADKIIAESFDSEFKINSINNLSLRSTRDKINISQIEYLYGSSSFSKFDIDDLGSELDYDLKFGHINIFNIHKMFTFLKVDSKFANIGLSFMQGSKMALEIKHKSVKITTDSFKLNKKPTNEKNKYISSATVGKGENFSEVNIRANNCKIRLN